MGSTALSRLLAISTFLDSRLRHQRSFFLGLAVVPLDAALLAGSIGTVAEYGIRRQSLIENLIFFV